MKRNAPGLQNLITRMPADGYPAVDWWCPRLGDAMMGAAKLDSWLAAEGRTRSDTWVYTAGNAGSDVPALHLDVPGIEARLTPLAVWREGFGGLLFWCVNHWPVDPWLDPMVYPRQNGNGALLYPGKGGPVASQRLKLLRDGFEDVAYASLLAAREDDLAERVLTAMPMLSALDWERDPARWLAWRRLAGDLLGGNEEAIAERLPEFEGSKAPSGRALVPVAAPGESWSGGSDSVKEADGSGNLFLRFTLGARNNKIRRKPGRTDWRSYDTLLLDLRLLEGEPTRLNFKLSSGLLKRKSFTWEMHLAPGEARRVRIPIPHERLDTGSVREMTIFLWEPDAARRFELAGAWLQ